MAEAKKPRQGEFAKLPLEILAIADVGLSAKVVLSMVVKATWGKKESFPSGQTIARQLCVSPNTVSRCLGELERAELLQLDRRQFGNLTVYQVPEWVTKLYSHSKEKSGVGHQNGEPGSPKCIAMGHQNGEPKNRTREKNKEKTITRCPRKKAAPKTPREPDVIWDAVAARWFESGVTESNRKRIGKIVRDLKDFKATPESIEARVEAYQRAWPTAACTPEAIVKHWDHPFKKCASKAGSRMREESDAYFREAESWKRDMAKTGPDRRRASQEGGA